MERRARDGEFERRGNTPADVPSPARIRKLAAQIRESWSPKTRASRSVGGSRRVQIAVVSTRELDDWHGLRHS